MRTVTFSDPRVIERLSRDFTCAWRNIRPKTTFPEGSTLDRAGGVKRLNLANGTGDTNICSVFATPDGRIVHAVPGYCDPETFLRELDFGLEAVRRASGADRGERLAALYSDRLEYPAENDGKRLIREALRFIASSSPLPSLDTLTSTTAGVAPKEK